MALIENTLWGERNKVDIAIKRLREFEPPEGYYLAFSGGKDSITIYRLAEMAGVKFDAHYNITTVDPPELVQFIRSQYLQVEQHRPEMSMFRLIKHKKCAPTRFRRYCCEKLKERGGHNRFVVTGVRWEESSARAKRQMVHTCFKDGTKTFLHPIIDWTSDDVWEFIHQEKLAYCSLYDEGFTRIGCILCPLAHRPERDIERWPQFVKAYINTFDDVLTARQVAGLVPGFETGQEMFNWWIKRNTKKGHSDDQMVLFE